MLHIVLYQPEIPGNTGNVIRLAANTGAQLHLIEPLGFRMDAKELKRAGLDYHEYASVKVHAGWEPCATTLSAQWQSRRVFALSTKNSHTYSATSFQDEDVFVFGSETRGLPPEVLTLFAPAQRLRIPMRPDNRSLNLSNAVAVVVMEAWRQLSFAGSAPLS